MALKHTVADAATQYLILAEGEGGGGIDPSAIFSPIASQMTSGVAVIAPIALGVFGVIWVLFKGKKVFRGLAS